jgi:RNA polymerase sigma factor (sigma-70 family)
LSASHNHSTNGICPTGNPQTADPTLAIHLIRQVANQDRDAFSQLYDRCSSLVFSLAMRMLKVRSDAEDLLQEVFVQVWRQASNYSAERGSPEAWIINIARSRAIDKIRSIRRMEKSFVLTDDPAGGIVKLGASAASRNQVDNEERLGESAGDTA